MSGAAARDWTVFLFGGFRATHCGGRAVERFRTQKGALLLAFLACRPGRWCSREAVGEILWPSERPDLQRARLRYELATLRRQLDDSIIETAGHQQVRLAPSCTSDVAEFDASLLAAVRAGTAGERIVHLRAAAAILTAGEPLESFYDAWALEERHRLTEAAFDALVSLIRHQRDAGEWEEANHWERTLRARFPDRADEVTEALPSLPEKSFLLEARQEEVITPPDAFVGRHEDMATIEAWIAGGTRSGRAGRLLTVTGLGGMGKTRLVLECIQASRRHGAGRGAMFVPLETVRDPDRLFESLRIALKIPAALDTRAGVESVVTGWLREQRDPLLILDNFEQIVDGGAERLSRLLAAVPSLRCLVTSRRRLEIAGERELPLAGLPLDAATALFLTRVSDLRQGWTPSAREREETDALCRDLEGIPLAIELAAARSLIMGPAQIRAHLSDRFGFLVSRRRDTEERHRALRTTLEWSVALLTPETRRFFAGLSVFSGGFTLDAAAVVCTGGGGGDPTAALEALEELRSHSLVTVRFGHDDSKSSGVARYTLLETVRDYAESLLTDSDRAAARRRHRDYYLDVAESQSRAIVGPDQTASVGRLARRWANLRAALEESYRSADTPEGRRVFWRLVRALRWFWERRGMRDEALLWQERAAAVGEPLLAAGDFSGQTELSDLFAHAEILKGFASSLQDQDSRERIRALYEQARTLYRLAGDASGEARTLNELCRVAFQTGDYREAERRLRESLDAFSVADRQATAAVAWHFLGAIQNQRGDYDEAERTLSEARRLYEESENPEKAGIVASIGMVAWNRGDLERAEVLYRESLERRRRQAYPALEASCLTMLGAIAAQRGRYKEARRLHDEALRKVEERADPRMAALIRAHRGMSCLRSGDYSEAEGDIVESLRLRRQIGDRRGIAEALEYQADLAVLTHGDMPAAITLWAKAALIRADLSAPVPAVDRPWREARYAEATATLGEETFDSLWLSALLPSQDGGAL